MWPADRSHEKGYTGQVFRTTPEFLKSDHAQLRKGSDCKGLWVICQGSVVAKLYRCYGSSTDAGTCTCCCNAHLSIDWACLSGFAVLHCGPLPPSWPASLPLPAVPHSSRAALSNCHARQPNHGVLLRWLPLPAPRLQRSEGCCPAAAAVKSLLQLSCGGLGSTHHCRHNVAYFM